MAVELAEQQRAIAVAEQSRLQSEAQAAADQARARAVAEEERVFTARDTETAERRKRVEIVQAEAEASRIRALAARIHHEVEAEGLTLMNTAANLLTPEARQSALRRQLVDKLEGIIRESVKPLERIEGIRVLHVEGLGGGTSGGQGNGGNVADSVVNSALRFRAQAPLIDQLLREIGVQGGDVGQAAKALLERGEQQP
jgi:uncharacterized membrane protein YqiK